MCSGMLQPFHCRLLRRDLSAARGGAGRIPLGRLSCKWARWYYILIYIYIHTHTHLSIQTRTYIHTSIHRVRSGPVLYRTVPNSTVQYRTLHTYWWIFSKLGERLKQACPAKQEDDKTVDLLTGFMICSLSIFVATNTSVPIHLALILFGAIVILVGAFRLLNSVFTRYSEISLPIPPPFLSIYTYMYS